jgi:hypothetical protein
MRARGDPTSFQKPKSGIHTVCVILSLMARGEIMLCAKVCWWVGALWREAKLCHVLKFVGGSVGRGGFSDPCRVATFSVIGSSF